MARVHEVVRYLRESLWFIPALFAVGSLVMAGALLLLDRAMEDVGTPLPVIYGGSVEGAREVLSTIAMSMLTFTGLVFTITMLVLQAASNQLSPRVLRTFLRDRGNQAVLGLFIATFLFALVVLRFTHSPEDADNGDAFVPGLSISSSFLLLIASIGAFIYYIDHMAHAIRASTVIHNLASETRAALDDLFPEPVGEPATADDDEPARAAIPTDPPRAEIDAPRSGVLVGIEEDRLVSIASASDEGADGRFVELVPYIGDYLAEGSALYRLWGSWTDDELDALRGTVELGREREIDQDVAFGVRQLVDIALRGLSPGINDPTTATQAIDRVHDLLHRLAQREFPSPLRRDESGSVVLYLPRPSWEDYVVLATEELRLAAEGQVHVLRRLRQMLEEVSKVAPPARTPPLRAAIERADRSIGRGLGDEVDRRIARPGGVRGQEVADR